MFKLRRLAKLVKKYVYLFQNQPEEFRDNIDLSNPFFNMFLFLTSIHFFNNLIMTKVKGFNTKIELSEDNRILTLYNSSNLF